MKSKIFIIWILFCIIIFSLKDGMLFALPDIAHEDMTRMSNSIKRNLGDSKTNGLTNAMGGDEEKAIANFDAKFSLANVSQDYPPNSLLYLGCLHRL